MTDVRLNHWPGHRDHKAAKEGSKRYIARLASREKRDRILYEKLNAMAPVGEDRPVCLVCGGASATWDGHDGCRGRKVA